MKRFLITAVCCLASLHAAFSQDIILKHDATEIEAKVEEIGELEIRYRLWSNLSGPLRTIKVADVLHIKYADGTIEMFEAASPNQNTGGYRIGDIYNENGLKGVVVYVTDDGAHGLLMYIGDAIKKKAYDKTLRWCHKNLVGRSIGATDEDDGERNMQTVSRAVESNNLSWDLFPMFKICRDLGDGWYLPAINEVEQIIKAVNGGAANAHWDDYRISEFNGKVRQAGNLEITHFEKIPSSTESLADETCFRCFVSKGFKDRVTLSLLDVVPDGYDIVESRLQKHKAYENMTVHPVHKF